MVICVLYSVESKLRRKGERDKRYSGLQHCIFMRYGNLLADHDFLWNSQSTQPSNEKLKLNHGTIGCLYFARAPTATSCQPFASTSLQIIQQGGSSLVGWKVINCRNDTHVILSAVDIVPELKKVLEKHDTLLRNHRNQFRHCKKTWGQPLRNFIWSATISSNPPTATLDNKDNDESLSTRWWKLLL